MADREAFRTGSLRFSVNLLTVLPFFAGVWREGREGFGFLLDMRVCDSLLYENELPSALSMLCLLKYSGNLD